MMAYMDFALKIHDSVGLELNRCFEETKIPEWMIQEKTTLIQVDPPPKESSPASIDDKVSAYDSKNPNSTD